MSQAKPIAVLLLVVGCSVGCDDTKELSWEIRFESEQDRQETALIVTSIRSGGCDEDALEIYTAEIQPDGIAINYPSKLPSGIYGFSGTAISTDCLIIAERCDVFELPLNSNWITTLLERVEPRRLCASESCDDGICGQPGDGDADVFDSDVADDADVDVSDSDVTDDADVDVSDSDVTDDADINVSDSDVADDADADEGTDSDVEVDSDLSVECPTPPCTCTYTSTGRDQELKCRLADGYDECYSASWPICRVAQKPNFVVSGLPTSGVLSAWIRYDCYDCDHPSRDGSFSINSGPPMSISANSAIGDDWQTITQDIPVSSIDGNTNILFFDPDAPPNPPCVYYRIDNVQILTEGNWANCP